MEARAKAAEKESKRYVRFLKTEQIKRKALKWEHSTLAAELEEVRRELKVLADMEGDTDRLLDAQFVEEAIEVIWDILRIAHGARGKEIVAERDRYREALEYIADCPYERQCDSCNETAKAALPESGKSARGIPRTDGK